VRRAVLLAFTVGLVAAPAAGTGPDTVTYRGAGVDDPAMPVKLKRTGRSVRLAYTDVLVGCTDGSDPRQGGASHLAALNARNRFKDRLEVGRATSVVRGRVRRNRASGTIAYTLRYDGGECRSGELEWRARRRHSNG
jgi:hypothetical protein